MRKPATWSILVAGALALTSCSSSNSSTTAAASTTAPATSAPATSAASTDTTTAPAPTTTDAGPTTAAAASGNLTVWVDSARQPAAKAYADSHPGVKVNIVTFDGDGNGATTLQAKIQLWNRTNSGWPDVIFSEQANDPVWMAQKPFEFAADLKPLIPADILSQWPAPSTAQCTVNGVQVCVQDNIAPDVLWVNQKKMDAFGYKVPTTWQEWAALGNKVATEHPGYIIGTLGDSYSAWIYFWANQCPLSQVTGPNQVTINQNDKHCTDMAALLDPLLKNKTVPPANIFTPEFPKTYGGADDKILLMPGPVWYGPGVFKDTFKIPAGEITAAAPLKWEGASDVTTGQVGGGPWVIAKHSANLPAAAEFVTYVTTQYQGGADGRVGYPAFGGLADAWFKVQGGNKYYAADPTPAMKAASDKIWQGWNMVTYPDQPVWSNQVVTKLVSGSSLSSLLKPFGDTLAQTAQAAGYQVSRG